MEEITIRMWDSLIIPVGLQIASEKAHRKRRKYVWYGEAWKKEASKIIVEEERWRIGDIVAGRCPF